MTFTGNKSSPKKNKHSASEASGGIVLFGQYGDREFSPLFSDFGSALGHFPWRPEMLAENSDTSYFNSQQSRLAFVVQNHEFLKI